MVSMTHDQYFYKICCSVYQITPCPISLSWITWFVSTRNPTENDKPYSPGHHVTTHNFIFLIYKFFSRAITLYHTRILIELALVWPKPETFHVHLIIGNSRKFEVSPWGSLKWRDSHIKFLQNLWNAVKVETKKHKTQEGNEDLTRLPFSYQGWKVG
jgi:hypothetical protein